MHPFYPSGPNQNRPTKPFDQGSHQAMTPNASHQFPVPPFAQQNARGGSNCDPNQIAMQQMQALNNQFQPQNTPMFNNPNNPSMQQSMQNQAAFVALNAQLMAHNILMNTVRPFNQYPMNLNPLAMMAMQNQFCPVPQNFQSQFNMNGVVPQRFPQNMNQPMMGMLQGQFPSQNPICPMNTAMPPLQSVQPSVPFNNNPLSSALTSGAPQGNMKSFDTAALPSSSNQNSRPSTAIPPNQIRPWNGGHQSQQARFRNPQSHQKGRLKGREKAPRIPKSNQHGLPKRPPLRLNYSEQEVRQWREARKRNFPTTANTLENLAALKVESNPILDDEARLRRRQLKEILNKQAELGVEVAELPPDYLSDGAVVTSRNNIRKTQNKNNKRGRRGQDNRNANKKQKLKQKLGDQAEAERKPSLLQKLLKNEIEADQSKLLQVFTFMTLNSFFEHWPENPLEFLQITANGNEDRFRKISREAECDDDHDSDDEEDDQVVEDEETLICPQGGEVAEKSEEGEISC